MYFAILHCNCATIWGEHKEEEAPLQHQLLLRSLPQHWTSLIGHQKQSMHFTTPTAGYHLRCCGVCYSLLPPASDRRPLQRFLCRCGVSHNLTLRKSTMKNEVAPAGRVAVFRNPSTAATRVLTAPLPPALDRGPPRPVGDAALVHSSRPPGKADSSVSVVVFSASPCRLAPVSHVSVPNGIVTPGF